MYNVPVLVFIILITYFTFRKYLKSGDLYTKFYFSIIFFSLLLYVGVGGASVELKSPYYCFYGLYLLSIWVGIKLYKPRRILHDQVFYEDFLNKYALKIVVIYFLLNISLLLYPDFKLLNLINPPSLDLRSAFEKRFSGENSLVVSIIRTCINFCVPFFYFSLYFFRHNIKVIAILLLSILYIQYCNTGYLGRSDIMIDLVVLITVAYISKIKWRKYIVLFLILTIPSVTIFLVKFAQIRLENTVGDISFFQAVELLFYGESSYPLLFDEIYKRESNLNDLVDYIYWLLTLVLPISPSIEGVDVGLNYKISEYLLHCRRGETGFFVILPGLLGEAYFVFGKLFWLHGMLYGYIIAVIYNFFKYRSYCLPLGMLVAVVIGYSCARGGTPAAYPLAIKQVLYFYIFLRLYAYNKHIKNI